jgi:flagellar biosynthesis protein FlhB
MAEGEGGEKTQAASAARLTRAHAEGHAPVSREAAPFAALGGATLVLAMAGAAIAGALASALARLLSLAGGIDSAAGLRTALRLAGHAAALAILPVALAALAGGGFATLLQTGGALRLDALLPDPSRLSPGAGIARLVSPDQLVAVLKAVLKVGVMGAVLAALLASSTGLIATCLVLPEADFAALVRDRALGVLAALLLVQAAIAALDLLYTRMHFAQSLRMSREDVKEEAKSAEGDPHVRARRRALRSALRRSAVAPAMKTATVVVTNPTHYAVALAYRRGADRAPIVVAKGTDRMAERIRRLAAELRVPVLPNPPLARALHRVEIDSEIPAEHFKVVAEIIAYVWRLEAEARARRVA